MFIIYVIRLTLYALGLTNYAIRIRLKALGETCLLFIFGFLYSFTSS